jgi:hypothetical protein
VILNFLLKGIYDRILNFKKKLPNGENLPKNICQKSCVGLGGWMNADRGERTD